MKRILLAFTLLPCFLYGQISYTFDSEWDTAAKINAATTDEDFLVESDLGSTVQDYDADLDTWAGITPSANVQSVASAADFAAIRALLDLEAGTDFYSVSAADSAFQPLDGFLTDIAALTDPGADRLAFWDDSAGEIVWLTVGTNLTITDTTIAASGGVGGGDLSATDIDTLTEWAAIRTDLGDSDVTAGATQDYAGATLLTAQFSTVATAAADGDGIRIPEASTRTPEERLAAENTSDYWLWVYPSTGDDLGLTTDTATKLYPGEIMSYKYVDDDTISLNITRDVAHVATYSSAGAISEEHLFGWRIRITSAGTYTLPALSTLPPGSKFSVKVVGAIAVTINPDDADLFELDGTALDDGAAITQTGGFMVFMVLADGSGWEVDSTGATDAG
jgi:hypothetical protein